jgi:hypothetical protein
MYEGVRGMVGLERCFLGDYGEGGRCWQCCCREGWGAWWVYIGRGATGPARKCIGVSEETLLAQALLRTHWLVG